MATDRNRVMVNLDDATYAAFHRLAVVTEKPLATSIRSMLEELHPYVNETAEALEKAKKAPDEALAKMHSALIKAQASAGQLSLHMDSVRGANDKRAAKSRGSR